MIRTHRVFRFLTRPPSLPAMSYVAVVLVLGVSSVFALVDGIERYDARNAALETLDRLGKHAQISSAATDGLSELRPPGSSFLEGQTRTLASAALLQRVTGAITQAGGSVVSTEIEPFGRQPNDGALKAIANFEIQQSSLQQLLYDIEAGMPFLYVDQLSVVVPPNEDRRIRVLLGVYGLWRGEN